MKAVIEYTTSQNSIIEKILEDSLNEGWSVQDGDITLAGDDFPAEKIEQLKEAGIKVHTQIAEVEELIHKTNNEFK